MKSMTYREPTTFPVDLRAAIERLCESTEIAHAGAEVEGSARALARDALVQKYLQECGYSTQRNVKVADGSRFDMDVVVDHADWRAAISVQGGQAARIDLDLLKVIAFGRTRLDKKPLYGVVIASDKPLLKTITGTPTATTIGTQTVAIRNDTSITGQNPAYTSFWLTVTPTSLAYPSTTSLQQWDCRFQRLPRSMPQVLRILSPTH